MSEAVRSATHRLTVRIYYEDTDFSGLIYHARYLHFLERGRTEALRAGGLDHATLIVGDDPLMFAVRKMTIAWLAPARIDDLIEVRTVFENPRGARVMARQEILRGDTRLIDSEAEIVCLTPDGRPRRLPTRVIASMSR